MQPFCRKYQHWWSSKCKVCGAYVTINDNPAPNDIEIGGAALAVHCTGDNDVISISMVLS